MTNEAGHQVVRPERYRLHDAEGKPDPRVANDRPLPENLFWLNGPLYTTRIPPKGPGLQRQRGTCCRRKLPKLAKASPLPNEPERPVTDPGHVDALGSVGQEASVILAVHFGQDDHTP
jgi:hypothetical protein